MSDWIPLHERERLSIPHLLAISANQLSANMIWTPIGLLLNPLCTTAGLNNVYTTLVILIGPVVGLVVPSVAAAMSDRCMLKWGRRRIFLVVGGILSVIGLLFLALGDKITENKGGQITFLVLGQTIVSIGGNIFGGPGRTMCTDLTPESQQVTISNFCQVHGALGGILSNLIGTLKISDKVGMENPQFVLLFSCIVGFIALIISILASHEEQLTEPPAEGKNSFQLIFESFKLFTVPLWFVAASQLFFQLGANQYNTQVGNFMGMVIFNGDPNKSTGTTERELYDEGVAHSQLLALIQTVVQFIFSFLSNPLTNLIGLKGIWVFGLTAGTIAQLLYFAQMNQYVYIICAILWALDQTVGSVPFSVVSIYAPKEYMAGMLAVITFVGNISGFLCNFIFTMGLGSVEWFKSNPGRLIALPFFFTVAGAICGWVGIYKLENESKETLDNDVAEEVDDSGLKA